MRGATARHIEPRLPSLPLRPPYAVSRVAAPTGRDLDRL